MIVPTVSSPKAAHDRPGYARAWNAVRPVIATSRRPKPITRRSQTKLVLDGHEAIAQEPGDRQESLPQDRRDATDAERHVEPLSFGEASPPVAHPESGVERTEQDVRDVERAEWAFFEHRREFVAVALSPGGRIAADEQRPHGSVCAELAEAVLGRMPTGHGVVR